MKKHIGDIIFVLGAVAVFTYLFMCIMDIKSIDGLSVWNIYNILT